MVCNVIRLPTLQAFNAPQQPQRNFVPITSYQNDISDDGSYQFNYLSGDGSQQQARGYLKNLGQKDREAQVVQGSYSYTSPDGTPITVTYIADENGEKIVLEAYTVCRDCLNDARNFDITRAAAVARIDCDNRASWY